MKMKHFAILPLAAAVLLFGCSKDNSNGGKGIPEGEKTYATFNFNLGAKAKGYVDFEPTPQTEDATNEALIGTGDLYILVFNATNKALEYKARVEGNTHTALLTSGQKKIFVLANIANVEGKLQTVDMSDLSADGAAATYAGLTEGTTTLDDFYKIAFNAGTPQAHDINKYNYVDDEDNVERTFSVIPLYTLVDEGTLGLPMSNHNGNIFTLKPGITEDLANTPISDVADIPTYGTEQYNRFKVELDYMGAKARLIADMDAINAKQDIAYIDYPRYTVKNLAKFTSLVQNYVAAPQSIYHNMNFALVSNYAAFVDQASTASANVWPATNVDGDDCPYIYVPENTNANLLRGQSSFYALNVTYKPNNIVTKVKFNKLTDNVDVIETQSYDNIYNIANAASEGATEYIGDVYVYVPVAIEGIPAGFYQSAELLTEAVWMSKYGMDINDPASTYVYEDAHNALVSGKYKSFVNAQSWYRIDIGVGSGSATKYGVLRGNAYTATVNNITGPGVPTEKELFEEPQDPVLARTYINVTIVAKGWSYKTQGIDL